ncbi:MAG: Formyltetrahydrofolate deformylase [Chlamydiia bacterium]|nr:Formyltetrahydrofolate deformylase [Chlamydiia bacterium]
MNRYTLKISCLDKPSIISKLTSAISDLKGNITDLDQYSDSQTKNFFFRMMFKLEESNIPKLLTTIEAIKAIFGMKISLYQENTKKRILILCSKQQHCLIHLLGKVKQGAIPVEISHILSNHTDCEAIAAYHNVPFHHLPIEKDNKREQEILIERVIDENKIDYIVLARYMQILSSEFCKKYEGQIINIHHSFLPGFKGANPYKQAHERGVKIIGATSHFVTEDLDEGPIICQETIRVNHHHSVQELTRFGSDIESVVLSRAVKHVAEDKVFIDGKKTVVFK